jgi:hypothetical protein
MSNYEKENDEALEKYIEEMDSIVDEYDFNNGFEAGFDCCSSRVTEEKILMTLKKFDEDIADDYEPSYHERRGIIDDNYDKVAKEIIALIKGHDEKQG